MALLRLDEEIKPRGRLEGCVSSDERGAEAWGDSAIVVGVERGGSKQNHKRWNLQDLDGE